MGGREVTRHGSSILVASLSSTFGVVLLLATDNLVVLINGNAVTGHSVTVHFILSFIALVFIAIAIYVGAVVTANTFATIVAGRTRTIALLRLIGSSATAQRRAIAREGLLVGVIGSAIGLAVGIGANALLVGVAEWTRIAGLLAFSYVDGEIALPVVAVILITWLASWIGSRRVLVVTPIEATGLSVGLSHSEVVRRGGRNTVALVLVGGGVVILLGAVALGQLDPRAILVGVVGGILSFTGVVLAAPLIMPPTLRLVGRALGRGAASRIAAQNALRYPERSARTTIGLVIGVALVTMFVVASQTVEAIVAVQRAEHPEQFQGTAQVLLVTSVIFGIVGGFSAVIAAVGMVNNLSLSVVQRTRELGLLRALGFTARQIRRMIVAESAQLAASAVIVGLGLGIFYGWAGAECMLGSLGGGAGLTAPVVPLPFVGGVVLAAAVLTVVASLAPARRATRVTPVAALAVD